MLPVKDYLEMALLDQSGNFDALKMGVQMTRTNCKKRLTPHTSKKSTRSPATNSTRTNIKQCRRSSSGQEPNTIVSVMKKGYTLSDRDYVPQWLSWRNKNPEGTA